MVVGIHPRCRNSMTQLIKRFMVSLTEERDSLDKNSFPNSSEQLSVLDLLDNINRSPPLSNKGSPIISKEEPLRPIQQTLPSRHSSQMHISPIKVADLSAIGNNEDFHSDSFWKLPSTFSKDNIHKQQANKNKDMFQEFLQLSSTLTYDLKKYNNINKVIPENTIKEKNQNIQDKYWQKTILETDFNKVFQNTINVPNQHLNKTMQHQNVDKNQQVYEEKKWSQQNILKNAKKKGQFKETINCVQALRQKTDCNKLKIMIKNHQIIERNFLLSDYVMFEIEVLPLNYIVKRNYQDFTRFKLLLNKQFPGFHFPQLKKQGWFVDISKQTIQKQKNILQLFLNTLLRNYEIRNSKIFEQFLTLREHKQMKRRLETYQSMQQPQSIQDITLKSGKITVQINAEQKIFNEQFLQYYQSLIYFLEKEIQLNQILSEQYSQINKTYHQLAQVQNNIIAKTRKFNIFADKQKINSVETSFQIIKKSYNEQNKFIEGETKILSQQLLPFLKFQLESIVDLKQLAIVSDFLHKTYTKRVESGEKQTNEGYGSPKLTEFKVGVLNQSRNLTVLKYQTGYINSIFSAEVKRVLQDMADQLSIQWKTQCKQKIANCYNLIKFLSPIVQQ